MRERAAQVMETPRKLRRCPAAPAASPKPSSPCNSARPQHAERLTISVLGERPFGSNGLGEAVAVGVGFCA